MAEYGEDGIPQELLGRSDGGFYETEPTIPDGTVIGPDGVSIFPVPGETKPTEEIELVDANEVTDLEDNTDIVGFDPFIDDDEPVDILVTGHDDEYIFSIGDEEAPSADTQRTKSDKPGVIRRAGSWAAEKAAKLTELESDSNGLEESSPSVTGESDTNFEDTLDFTDEHPVVDPLLDENDHNSLLASFDNQEPQVFPSISAPLSEVITRKVDDLRDHREQRRIDRENARLEAEQKSREKQLEDQRWLDYLKGREDLERQIIELQSTVNRFTPSPVEGDSRLGIKNFGLISDITRAYLAIELHSATGVTIESSDFGDLAGVERSQVKALVDKSINQESLVRKVDLDTELDERRRREVWSHVAKFPDVMVNTALRRILPEIYVMPKDGLTVDLDTIGREHRESAFDAIKRFNKLRDYEWGIDQDTREITLRARMIPIVDGDSVISYVFADDFNGIDKVLDASGKTLENEDPKGRDLRISGAFSLGPRDGGIVYSAHLSDVKFENVLPQPAVRPKEVILRDQLSDVIAQHAVIYERGELGVQAEIEPTSQTYYTDATIDQHMRNPSLIAEFTIEPRHLTPTAFNEIQQAIIDRLSGHQATPVDPRDIAKAVATFVKDGAVHEIDRFGTARQAADKAAVLAYNNEMTSQGYPQFANTSRPGLTTGLNGAGTHDNKGAIETTAHTTEQDVLRNPPTLETDVVNADLAQLARNPNL